jgi:hypothetical protein
MPKTKKNRSVRKYTKKYCSPSSSSYKFSCFNKKSLLKIAKSWNKNNPNNKIKINGKTVKEIWGQIDNKLKKKCNDELCWTKQDFLKNSNVKKSFKPLKPKSWNHNKFEWLSTTDIENVIKQYEEKYPNFRFIGAVPMDFDSKYGVGQCIVNELCNVNLKKMIMSKIFKIGIVFNLDKHNQDGSHWVSMFIDLKKDGIYYFDSYGTEEPKEVKNLANRLLEQAKGMGKLNMKYKVNKIRHQFKNSECGVYCINFIVSMLEGETFENYTNNILKDTVMNEKREIYFSPNTK